MQELIKSRRFWATAASVVVILFKDRFASIGLTEEQVSNIVLAIGAWVVGESVRSSQQKAA